MRALIGRSSSGCVRTAMIRRTLLNWPRASVTMRFWEANSRSALLLTEDKDFGELVHRLGRVHAGIVLIRLAGLPPTMKAGIVAKVLQDHAAELQAAFTVISPG